MEIDSGNTAWILAAAALVLLMTPALGFFYGGLTRSKNILGTIMQSFIVISVVGVLWVVVGYSLAFGPDATSGLIGDLSWFGLKDVGQEPGGPNGAFYGLAVPHEAFMAFQMMFAIITPALITGAFAERAKFGPFLVFMAAWSLLVYAPIAHWVFAYDGLLSAFDTTTETGLDSGINSLDFAGGLAIHVNAGVAAIAAVLVFGKRKGYGSEPMEPSNITYVVLGGALLWFGWFGFNGGSAGGANGQAANAFVVTNTAAAVAALTWMFLAWQFSGKASVVGAVSGAVAGLVAITPASGFVQPMEAIAIGFFAGALCYGAVRLRSRLAFDDSLDVVGVHGVGGAWGAIATGLFANSVVSGIDSFDGAFYGNVDQLWDQLIALAIVATYSLVATYIILKVLDLTVGIRVSEEEEDMGLDVSQHGERGYVLDEAIGVPLYQAPPIPVSVPGKPAPAQQQVELSNG
ncbi:MAG TPA: ammonium transporter [Dehalococcoidia bacterium]|nr:ammonium transporter [Dehalococcoidia bacterium]